jgi:hypothetical protein
MGIFFGGVIYGLRYSDLSGDDYVTVYERPIDIGFPVDKATIRKILMDAERDPPASDNINDRIFEVYTYYITTHTNDSVERKSYMWRQISLAELKEYGSR